MLRSAVYDTIEQLAPAQVAALEGSPLDFSFGLLRAVERSLWGRLFVKYVTIEEDGELVALAPVYVGRNLNFNALMPQLIQRLYARMLDLLGESAGYTVAIVGSLISDRGWIPMRAGCDRRAALGLMLKEIDNVARGGGAHFCIIKDIHQEFPDAALFVADGYTRTFSLPTVRADVSFDSFEDYLQHLSKNGRHHARKNIRKAEKKALRFRFVDDYAPLVRVAFPLFRRTYLKAPYKFEELSPHFFEEMSRTEQPRSRMLLCEQEGRVVGVALLLFDAQAQQIKRIGIDYEQDDTGLVYNMLMYQSLTHAIEHKVSSFYMGQSSFTPKVRMGGRLEDQFLYLKGYSLSLRASFQAQKFWLNRYSVERVTASLAEGG